MAGEILRSVVVLSGTTVCLVLLSPGAEERASRSPLLHRAFGNPVDVRRDHPMHRSCQIAERDPPGRRELREPPLNLHRGLTRDRKVVVMGFDLEEIVLALRLSRIVEIIL